jgi:uncharacterized protein
MTTADDATPNPNGLAAQNLLRLSLLAGDDRWRHQADRLIDGLLPLAGANVFAHLSLLNAVDLRLCGAELVVIGPDVGRFAAAALKVPFVGRIVLRAMAADDLPAGHPAREAFARAGSQTAALICLGETCSLPVTDSAAIAAAVERMRGPSPAPPAPETS